MKKTNVSFRVIGNSGPLTLSWFEGPKGPAIEAKNGAGVGFFSKEGKLLCVEFDDVEEKTDRQRLDFDSVQVEIWVKNGKVKYEVLYLNETKRRA
jgi:hypothetical protein